MKETNTILVAWKNSRVLKRIGTEFPSKSAVIQGEKSSVDVRQYLTEQECHIVDEAILALKEDNYAQYAVIKAIYMKSLNCNKLARITGIKKTKIYDMLDDAERFIRGYIYPFFKHVA